MDIKELYKNIFDNSSDGIIITDLETGSILAANPAAAMMHGYERDSFCEMQMQELLHGKSESILNTYAEVIREGSLFEKIAQHIRKDDSLFFVEWRAVAIQYQDQICSLACLRDVSKRIRLEEKLKRRMKERLKEQSSLHNISHALASTLEVQPDFILNQLKVFINYTHASLFTLEDSTLIALAVRGIERLEYPLPFIIRLNGQKMLESLFNEHRPIRIADISAADPSARFLRTLLKNDSAVLLDGVQSWMWVPLAVKKRIVGGIGMAHMERNFFTPHHGDLAMTIANQAAITLVNAELHERAQELAALQERQRIAQNLHDAVNQSLFSAGIIAEVLPRLWEREPDEAIRSLEDLRRLIRSAMAEMRTLLTELRPDTLVDTELGDLLLILGNAFSGKTNIPVDVTVSGERDLPFKTHETLYRICQEAMNNIAKHAKASLVEIDVRFFPKGLELSIRDNGCGFDPARAVSSDHFGLKMMRERAESIGAVLNVFSQPGSGTEIRITWKEKER
jgi:two-component system nitrate/nitrite sensor histidine kinase NarX